MLQQEKQCIVLVSDLNYLNYTAFLVNKIRSISENPSINIFIITDNVEPAHFISRFESLGAVQLQVPLETFKDYSLQAEGHVSIATYYKLLIPSLVPENFEKCLYLDSDIYVAMNFDSIFDLKMNEPIAAVQILHPNCVIEPQEDYFNAGVLLMDLVAIRKSEYERDYRNVLKTSPNLRYQEQDVLNRVFRNRWMKLDSKYNYLAETELNLDLNVKFRDPVFVHLVSSRKPWRGFSHTIWHFKWRTEYSVFCPGDIDRIRSDSGLYRLIAVSSFSRASIFIKLFFPRRLKNFYLKFMQ